jgi:hypothetical protein
VGANTVRASLPVIPGEVLFLEIATTGAPDRITVLNGTNQRAGVGEPVRQRLEALVTDVGQNPIAGTEVELKVTEGGGLVDGASGTTVLTNADGVAAVTHVLGPDPSFDNNVVEAAMLAPTPAGEARGPATFVSSGFVLGEEAATKVSGTVLDNQGDPVPNCLMTVSTAPTSAYTAADGTFSIPVPSDPPLLHLHLDASTTTRPGVWSSLEFELPILRGVDNQLPRPIYTLPLDLANGQVANETTDVTVTVPGLPGFELIVLAGSATFAGGAKDGLVTVTTVHADTIPMAPGAGMQPRIIVSIQPPDVHFDPPAIFQIPNIDILAGGSVTEMFSFDHDLGMFASIGTGTVSEDGLTLRSDPGFGIVKGGWHCATPQSENCEVAALTADFDRPPDVQADSVPLAVAEGESFALSAVGSPALDTSWDIQSLGALVRYCQEVFDYRVGGGVMTGGHETRLLSTAMLAARSSLLADTPRA